MRQAVFDEVMTLVERQRQWTTIQGKAFEAWRTPTGLMTQPRGGKPYGGASATVEKVLGHFEGARSCGARLKVGHGRGSRLAPYLFPMFLQACRNLELPVLGHDA